MPKALTTAEIDDFRQDLCEVAAALFAAQGYEGVTMRAIAARLGVSPMTPYRYFEGKAAIYREVRRQAFARFGERTSQAADSEPDTLKRLHALFASYLGFAQDEPGAYRIMFELAPPPDAAPDAEDHALAEGTWQPLLGTLGEAIDQGLLIGDATTLANVCWVQVHGLASLHIAGRLTFGRSFDELFEPVFDTLLHGTLARPARGPTP